MNDDTNLDEMDEEMMSTLLNLATRPEEIDPRRAGRVRIAVEREWDKAIQARKRGLYLRVAVAASAILVLGLAILINPEKASPPPIQERIGRVAVVQGTVHASGETRRLIAAGRAIHDQDLVETSDSRATIRLDTGTSVRIDQESTVRFEKGALRLERGAIYIDSDPLLPSHPVRVSTPVGEVHEMGTQFEVRLLDERMRVRVREGRVTVVADGLEQGLERSMELTFSSAADARLASIAPWNSEWDWTQEIAPDFEIEGRTLKAFLEWAARESGYEIRSRPPGLDTTSVVLHGSIRGTRPAEAIETVLSTTTFDHRFEDSAIILSRRENLD